MSLDQIRDEDGNIMFNIGDTIPVVITKRNGERVSISYELAEKRIALSEFIDEYDDEEEYIVEGIIVRKNRGGFVVDVSGLEFLLLPKKTLLLYYFLPKINSLIWEKRG